MKSKKNGSVDKKQLEDLQDQIKQLKTENLRLRREVKKYHKKYRRYYAFFEISTDPFFIATYPGPPTAEDTDLWDYMAKWKIVEVNKATTKELGYSKRQLTHMNLGDVDTHYSSHHEQTKSIMSDLIIPIKKKGVFRVERDHVDSHGNKIAVEVKGQVVTINGNEYVVALVNDIRDRKRFEQEMLKSYNAERCNRRKLQGEVNKRIELTRSLVHELKTPLTPILASSEALVGIEKPNTIQAELAKNIYRGAKGLDIRIGELLDLAKTEISELILHKSTVLLSSLLTEVAEEIKPHVNSHEQKLILNIPQELPIISADPERIKQVLYNLLNNAIKYNRENGWIFIKAEIANGFVKVAIRDQGKGITNKEQKNLFQPYFRCEEDREKMNGLGLGLVLSKRLVELHEGTIELQSVRGKGTTVIFQLPLISKKRGSNE